MRTVLNFFVNAPKGQKIILNLSIFMMASLMIGLLLTTPSLWLEPEIYHGSWMNIVAPYLFLPFAVYTVVMVFIFTPYMWYVGNSFKYKGNSRGLLKGMAIFLSIIPGAFIYSYVYEALMIPHGWYNVFGALACGILYLFLMGIVLKKQFDTAQEYITLE